MTRHAYSYVVLQYRHDVWIGESLNVGVLLFSEGARFLKLKARTGRGRLGSAYPDLDYVALRDALQALERRFERLVPASGFFPPSGAAIEVGRKVLASNDNSLTWGITGSGVSDDLGKVLNSLYGRFVGRYEKVTGRDVRTDDMVFETIKRKLETAELYQRLERHVVHSRYATIPFDHAIQNGSWHVIQPISFDNTDEDRMLDKAAKWAGRLQSIADQENLRPYFVTGKPTISTLLPHYEKMIELLRASPLSPVVMDEDHSGELVARVLQHLHQ